MCKRAQPLSTIHRSEHKGGAYDRREAEIAEAVDFVVHVERQSGRRAIREVLALRGYDRDAKRFQLESVFEIRNALLSNATTEVAAC